MSHTKSRRALGIDLLRLIAAVQMISGHTIDALIDPALRTGPAWARWTMIRGLTAVAFLFASGVSFAMVAAQSPDRRGPRMRRALTLIAISYALHPPVALFSSDEAARAQSIADFFAVDVLACIGVTLLCLEGLARIGPRAFAWGSGVLGLLTILVAPLTAMIDPSGVLAPVLDYVTKRGGSLFPLLPYSGFALLGAAVGTLARPREPGRRALVVLGALSVALAVVALAWSETSPPPADAYYAWPAASFGRLAAVVGIAFALTLATTRIASLPHWMTTLAGETLFLYVSHLLLLYVGGVGLVHWIGPSLSRQASAAVAAALIAVCTAASLTWARYRDRPVTAR